MSEGITAEVPAGTRFGPHEIVRPLAEGGMAIVYEARHVELEKRVAVKVLRRAYGAMPEVVERFLLEARMASRLQHPHVIGVSDVGVGEGRPFMVIDYLEGEDLFTLLSRAGKLPLARVADILLPVVSAVAAAHADGIVHRDLKPENVFLLGGKRRDHPILLDFGISKVITSIKASATVSGRALTRMGDVLGTPQYMAPEQARGEARLDSRTDQYALGIVLYRCLTGMHPYPREDELEGVAALAAALSRGEAPIASAAIAGLPAAVDALVARCLRPSPSDRFESVRDVGRALWPFASPMTQAVWAEEFGDPEEILERLATPSRASVTRASMGPPMPPPGADELRAFSVFEGCSDEDLDELAHAARTRRISAGENVIEGGAHAHSCFLLLSGEVRFDHPTGDTPWNTRGLSAPCVLGHIALVANVPRLNSVVATTPCVVLEITREVFRCSSVDCRRATPSPCGSASTPRSPAYGGCGKRRSISRPCSTPAAAGPRPTHGPSFRWCGRRRGSGRCRWNAPVDNRDGRVAASAKSSEADGEKECFTGEVTVAVPTPYSATAAENVPLET
jgi:serine/threonine protein kinase